MDEQAVQRVIQAMNFFMDKGLTDIQAAGLVGNLYAESVNLNPKQSEIGHPERGQGIAQWTSKDRKNGLRNFAGIQNILEIPFEIQLAYVWKELSEIPYMGLSKLKRATNTDEATQIVIDNFERPSNRHDPKRQKYAAQFLQLIRENRNEIQPDEKN